MMWQKQKGSGRTAATQRNSFHTKKTEGQPLATLTPGGQHGIGNTPKTFNLLYKLKFGGLGCQEDVSLDKTEGSSLNTHLKGQITNLILVYLTLFKHSLILLMIFKFFGVYNLQEQMKKQLKRLQAHCRLLKQVVPIKCKLSSSYTHNHLMFKFHILFNKNRNMVNTKLVHRGLACCIFNKFQFHVLAVTLALVSDRLVILQKATGDVWFQVNILYMYNAACNVNENVSCSKIICFSSQIHFIITLQIFHLLNHNCCFFFHLQQGLCGLPLTKSRQLHLPKLHIFYYDLYSHLWN